MPAEPALLHLPVGVKLGIDQVFLGFLWVLRVLVMMVVVLGPLTDKTLDEAAGAGVLLLVDDEFAAARIVKGNLTDTRTLGKDALEAGEHRENNVANLALGNRKQRRLVRRQVLVDKC